MSWFKSTFGEMGSSHWNAVLSDFKACLFPSILSHVPWPLAMSSLHVCHGLPMIAIRPLALCSSDLSLCRKGTHLLLVFIIFTISFDLERY